ncbi:integrase arm-type DNA-binding domain-containing protein [Rosenbergiella metrosideri]|uniref:integrase arm-type DNA-binding domain-containing protein n=1 Tax=Rosenbergiella metrosideri TaxID=2921185 RepID=UPI0030C8B22A
MARTTRPLTNTRVLHSKAIDKDLTLHDGDGLFMVVKITGKKLWRFGYHAYLSFMEARGHQHPMSLTAFRQAVPQMLKKY